MPWTEVQRTTRVVGGFNTNVNVVFPSAVTAGNFILVELQASFSYGSPNDVTGFTISDTVANSYSSVFVDGSSSGGGIGYAANINGGSNTVSCLALTNSTPTLNDTGLAVVAIEYSGISTTTPLISSATLPSALGARSISLPSAPAADALVYSLYVPDGGQSLVASSPTISGFTHSSRTLTGDGYGDSAYGTGQQTCAWPDQMTSGGASAIIAAFSVAGGASPDQGLTLANTNIEVEYVSFLQQTLNNVGYQNLFAVTPVNTIDISFNADIAFRNIQEPLSKQYADVYLINQYLAASLNSAWDIVEDVLVTIDGTLVYTNANDTLSANATPVIVSTLNRTNSNDVSSGSGTTTVVASLNRTETGDTLAATGSVGSAVSSSLNYTNNNDTSSATSTTTVRGSLNYTAFNDTLFGTLATVVSGSLSFTNRNDTLAAQSFSTILSSANVTNKNDTSTGQGTTIVIGSSNATNRNDTLAASGSAGIPVEQIRFWNRLSLSNLDLGL